ncbi:unnamed protein product, partial [Pleuronectes platessa]
ALNTEGERVFSRRVQLNSDSLRGLVRLDMEERGVRSAHWILTPSSALLCLLPPPLPPPPFSHNTDPTRSRSRIGARCLHRKYVIIIIIFIIIFIIIRS